MTREQYDALNAPLTKQAAGPLLICNEGISSANSIVMSAQFEDALRRVLDLLPENPRLPLIHQIKEVVTDAFHK